MSSAVSTAVDPRLQRVRARVTNKAVLRGVDGRSWQARRFRDLARGFAAALGVDSNNAETRETIKVAAELVVAAEVARARLIAGKADDLDAVVKITNAADRAVRRLNLPRKPVAKQPSLAEYLASQQRTSPG